MKQFEIKWEKDGLNVDLEKLTAKEKGIFLSFIARCQKEQKSELKIEVTAEVEMKVIQMEDCIRGEYGFFTSKENVRLVSLEFPEISNTDDIIYVGGDDYKKDGEAAFRTFSIVKDAVSFVERAERAVAEFNNYKKSIYEVKIREKYKETLKSLSLKEQQTFLSLSEKVFSKDLELKFAIIVKVKIVQMDESLRGIGQIFSSERANGIDIWSLNRPELSSKTLFLKGSIQHRDGKLGELRFANPCEALNFAKELQISVDEFNRQNQEQ